MSAMPQELGPDDEALINNHQSLAVMAYRMGAVERNVAQLLERFDSVAQYYVTNATLILMLDPIKERLKELEDAQKEREQSQNVERGQFRIAIAVAIITAIITPLFTLLINYMMLHK